MPRRARSIFDFTGHEAEDIQTAAARTPRTKRPKRSVLALTPEQNNSASIPSPSKRRRKEEAVVPTSLALGGGKKAPGESEKKRPRSGRKRPGAAGKKEETRKTGASGKLVVSDESDIKKASKVVGVEDAEDDTRDLAKKVEAVKVGQELSGGKIEEGNAVAGHKGEHEDRVKTHAKSELGDKVEIGKEPENVAKAEQSKISESVKMERSKAEGKATSDLNPERKYEAVENVELSSEASAFPAEGIVQNEGKASGAAAEPSKNDNAPSDMQEREQTVLADSSTHTGNTTSGDEVTKAKAMPERATKRKAEPVDMAKPSRRMLSSTPVADTVCEPALSSDPITQDETEKTNSKDEQDSKDQVAEETTNPPSNEEIQPTQHTAAPNPDPPPLDKSVEEQTEQKPSAEQSSPKDTKQQKRSPEKDKPKMTLSFPKRVRFTEPDKSYRSATGSKVGLLSLMKMRRRRPTRIHESTPIPEHDHCAQDLSVPAADNFQGDEKGRQVLLDELQYLLDGVFKSGGQDGKSSGAIETQLVSNSLQSLVKLLLRKPKKPGVEQQDAQRRNILEPECGTLMKILVRTPQLLKQIVNRLFSKLGKSRLVDVMLALVFVIIFQSSSQVLLVEENDVDLLLNAFFRNSGASLKAAEANCRNGNDEKAASSMKYAPRRRGLLSRRLDDMKKPKNILASVNRLIIEADIVDEDFKGFQNETDGSCYLIGVALSLLMTHQEAAREWMRARENRRLDRVVAVLYSCERVMFPKDAATAKENGEQNKHKHVAADLAENRTTSIVIEASMKILDFASYDPVCRKRVASESRVGIVVLDLIRRITSIEEPIRVAESMLCCALKLCINLMRDCEEGAQQFVDAGGTQVIVDCLAREVLSAGLVQRQNGEEKEQVVEEMFDVRVLCMALLSNMAHKHFAECEKLRELQPRGVVPREGGAVALFLEILKSGGKKAHGAEKSSEDEKQENGDSTSSGVRRDKGGSQAEPTRMEDKVMVGYCCLLIGVVICKSEENKKLVMKAMTGQTLLALAAVVEEFWSFHHEVGIGDTGMDNMYNEIMTALTSAAELDQANPADKDIIALLNTTAANPPPEASLPSQAVAEAHL